MFNLTTRGAPRVRESFGFEVGSLDTPADAASPFGYAPSDKPSTTQARYSADVIAAFVREHAHIPSYDAFAQVNADIILSAYADYISKLPPHRQILLIDGGRPIGDMRSIALGESHGIRGKNVFGIYDIYADSLAVRTQTIKDEADDGNAMPEMRSIADIKNTIAHETGHQQDRQLPIVWGGEYGYWSHDSQSWKDAIVWEMQDNNRGQLLKDIIPDIEIRLHWPYYQDPAEAKAEFEMLFDNVYAQMGGDFEGASRCMKTAYPHMWPVFYDEYLAKAMKTAATLNPHIDMSLPPVGFDSDTAPIMVQDINDQNRAWLWQLEIMGQNASKLDSLDKKRGEWHATLQRVITQGHVNVPSKLETEISSILTDSKRVPSGSLSCRVSSWTGADPAELAKTLAEKIVTALDGTTAPSEQGLKDAHALFQSSETEAETGCHALHDELYNAQLHQALSRILSPVAQRLKAFADAYTAQGGQVDASVRIAAARIEGLAPPAVTCVSTLKEALDVVPPPQSRAPLRARLAALRVESAGLSHPHLQEKLAAFAVRISTQTKPVPVAALVA